MPGAGYVKIPPSMLPEAAAWVGWGRTAARGVMPAQGGWVAAAPATCELSLLPLCLASWPEILVNSVFWFVECRITGNLLYYLPCFVLCSLIF